MSTERLVEAPDSIHKEARKNARNQIRKNAQKEFQEASHPCVLKLVVAEKNKTEKFFNNLLLLILILSLFVIGGFVISLKIPFWSLFLGIAAIQIGIVLSVFTFDIISRRASKPLTSEYKTLACLICRTLNYVPKYKKTTICDNCQVKIATVAKPLLVLIFALTSLATLANLVQFNHDIRRKAQEFEYGYVCEEGAWNPSTCRCGISMDENCGEGELRECSDGNIYCCTKKDNDLVTWSCEPVQNP